MRTIIMQSGRGIKNDEKLIKDQRGLTNVAGTVVPHPPTPTFLATSIKLNIVRVCVVCACTCVSICVLCVCLWGV